MKDNSVGVEKLKESEKLNKSVYIDMTTLDLSKLYIFFFSFCYDILRIEISRKYSTSI